MAYHDLDGIVGTLLTVHFECVDDILVRYAWSDLRIHRADARRHVKRNNKTS